MKKLFLPLLLSSTLAVSAFADHHEGKSHGDVVEKHEDVVEGFDSNDDGKVSKDEFTQHNMKEFNRHDKNSDGVLSKEEQEEMAKSWSKK